MVKENLKCIHCGGKTQKNGKDKNKVQRYKCKSCGRIFNETVSKTELEREKRYAMIRKLYLEDGLSTIEIGNRLGVSSTVPQRILKSMGVTRSISESKVGKKRGSKFNVGDIIRLYQSGLSSIEVGGEIGCSKRTVINLLHENGISLDNIYEYDNPNTDEILKLYKSGSSMLSISKKIGVPYTTINSVLHKHGVVRTEDKYGLGVPYNEYLSKINEYEKYRRSVNSITNKQPIEMLVGYGERGLCGVDGAKQLDHKFSILEGFKQGISPELIGNINNLEFIPWRENMVKGSKCSITIEELEIRVRT